MSLGYAPIPSLLCPSALKALTTLLIRRLGFLVKLQVNLDSAAKSSLLEEFKEINRKICKEKSGVSYH